MKRAVRKLATKVFELFFLFWAYASTLIYNYRKKVLSFYIYEVKVYNLLYQFSHFPVPMEHLQLRKQKLAELVSINHHRAEFQAKILSCKPTKLTFQLQL